MDRSRIWVVIPVFNNQKTVFAVASRCRKLLEHVLVVDDGSTDTDVEKLFAGTDIAVIRHAKNLGKGMALRTALEHLQRNKAEFMMTIDADGQHDPDDIERFIPLLAEDDGAIIVGSRDFRCANIPQRSRFGRAFSNFWLQLETGQTLNDSQSGFRAYPVGYLSRMKLDGRHYDFEIEVLTRGAWSGLKLRQVPVKVFYPPEALRVSSFRPVRDNLRITLMHLRLIGRRLLPLSYPRLIKPPETKGDCDMILHPVKLLKSLLRENATPLGLAVSAGVGIFLGVLPLLSVHILTTIYVTSRLHLNKVMAVAIQNLCMPPLVPAACIELGHFMLYKRWLTEISFTTIFKEIPQRVYEWFLGSLILAPVLAVIIGAAVFFFAARIEKRNLAYAGE
ncbi:MAG: DUF2062 domain-containing protein [Candidatus Omnitrophota bacterium]